MDIYSMSGKQLNELANLVKDRLAEVLNIPELDDHVVVISKRGVFGRFWTRLICNKQDDELRIAILTTSEAYEREDDPRGREDLPEEKEKPVLKVVGQ